MQPGSTIIHLLDPSASDREPGTLARADAGSIARSVAARTPHFRHLMVSLAGMGLAGAVVSLRRMARPSDGRGLIHCYSRRGAEAARMSFGRRWPLVLSLGSEAPDRRGAFRIAGPDRLLRHEIESGTGRIGLAGAEAVGCVQERSALRRAMGIDERECVVGALAEPRGATNARWLVFFAGILVAGGLGLTVLVPREAAQVARMRRFHAMTRLNLRVIVVENGAEPGGDPDGAANAWSACDVAIARPDPHTRGLAPEAIGRAIRRSHLVRVPVISALETAPAPLYAGSLSESLLVLAGTTKQIARRLTDLIENRGLLAQTGERARSAALATIHEDQLAAAIVEAYTAAGPSHDLGRMEALS